MPGTVETVRLEPFDPESHADLVAGWLQMPHVAEWWGDPQQNLAEVLQRPDGGDDALISGGRGPRGLRPMAEADSRGAGCCRSA